MKPFTFAEWLFKMVARAAILFVPVYSAVIAVGAEVNYDLVIRIVNGCVLGSVMWRISED